MTVTSSGASAFGFTPEGVFADYVEHLKAEVAQLRQDVSFYRGKVERLEMSILGSETTRIAGTNFVKRTEAEYGAPPAPDNRPPIEKVTELLNSGVPLTRFQRMQAEFDKLTPEEQMRAAGIATPDPPPHAEVKQV
jgi:hypothetical protein